MHILSLLVLVLAVELCCPYLIQPNTSDLYPGAISHLVWHCWPDGGDVVTDVTADVTCTLQSCLSSCFFCILQKLQEQDERAEQLKDRLRWEQRELQVRLEQLQRGSERMRNNSQGSTMSSERSESDRGESGRTLKAPRVLYMYFIHYLHIYYIHCIHYIHTVRTLPIYTIATIFMSTSSTLIYGNSRSTTNIKINGQKTIHTVNFLWISWRFRLLMVSTCVSFTEDVEVDVESIVFDCLTSEGLIVTHTDADHCYSSLDKVWLWPR